MSCTVNSRSTYVWRACQVPESPKAFPALLFFPPLPVSVRTHGAWWPQKEATKIVTGGLPRLRCWKARVRGFGAGLHGFGVVLRGFRARLRGFRAGLRGIRAGLHSFCAGLHDFQVGLRWLAYWASWFQVWASWSWGWASWRAQRAAACNGSKNQICPPGTKNCPK